LFEDIGASTLEDAATNMAKAALQKFNKPAYILCSTILSANGRMIDGETLVRSIEKTGPQINLLVEWRVMILLYRYLCIYK
jgi:hypothetical protein